MRCKKSRQDLYHTRYNFGQCFLYAKIPFCIIQLSAGRPGGLVVLPSNITNIFLSLSLILTMTRFNFDCKNAKKKRITAESA